MEGGREGGRERGREGGRDMNYLNSCLFPDDDNFLIFANRQYINRINVNGDSFHIISEFPEQVILGIDYDYG